MIKSFQYGKLAERKVRILKANARIRHGGVCGTGQLDVCIQSAFFLTVAFRVPAHSKIKLTAKDAKNAKEIIKNSSSHCVFACFDGKRVYWMSKCSGCSRASDFTRMVFLVRSSISCSHLPLLALRALATSGLTRNITSRSKCRAILRSST